ncbi:MAG: zf-HC2 domain-containing protein [Acidobacteriota bacterium]
MRCEKVLGHLSLFLDEMLEVELADGVSQHLRSCSDCSRELGRLKKLRNALTSLEPVEAPDYFYDLVNLKISRARQESWRKNLQSAFECWWSRVRTTEGMWYVTRLMGAMATIVFFIAISSAMNPIYLGLSGQLPGRGGVALIQPSQQLAKNLQKVFGSPLAAQKKPIRSSDPKINDQYLANLAQSVSRTAHDDTVSVVAVVDRLGAAKVQDVLEYPSDDSLLSDFTDMIMTAGWRPASQNGRAVDAWLVLTFSKIYVYN